MISSDSMREPTKSPSLGGFDKITKIPIFLSDPPLSGEENMGRDREWLRLAEHSRQPITVFRFYQWREPTVSVGRNQQIETAVDLKYCESRGIPIVRRPTGGRAVLHAAELTYAVISNRYGLIPMQRLEETYRFIAYGLLRGLREAGVDCTISGEGRSSELNPKSRIRLPCFTSTSRFEIVCQDRKIIGSAQRRLRKSFLQHGSIPLHIDYREMAFVLASDADFLKRKMISVAEAAPDQNDMSFQTVAASLESSFSKLLSGNK